MKRLATPVFVAMLSCSVLQASSSVQDRIDAVDSVGHIHPRMQAKWLSERGIDLSSLYAPREPTSGGTRIVGKWGRGPSVEVTGRDSLVFLSLGSEVAIVNFANPDSPQVLAEVQASGLVVQAAVKDSFLYIGVNTGAAGLEVWSIVNPATPVFRGRALTRLTDFCVKDTFAYVTMRMSSPSHDTFKVYNLADPTSPTMVGSCLDSGDAVTVAGNTVIQADWHDLHAIDVSDPANPHRVGTYPGYAISVEARNTICCAGFRLSQSPETHRFVVLDISNPASIHELGRLDDAGAYDIHLSDTFAYLSGYQTDYPFRIVSIADSAHPRSVGVYPSLYYCYGVWADVQNERAFVADDFQGVAVLDVATPSTPQLERLMLGAQSSVNAAVAGKYAYVANDESGLFILDVTNPSRPVTVSNYDTAGGCPFTRAVAVGDSFAFITWFTNAFRPFRSVYVADPANPTLAGVADGFNPAEDMALRGTYAYAAEPYRFEVYDVAQPRSPTLVGSCEAGDLNSAGLCLKDTFAYFAGPLEGLKVFSIANPASPRLLATLSGFRSWGCDVVDTFLLAPSTRDESLHIWSIADPSSPRVVSAVRIGSGGIDVKVRGRYAYTGCQPLQVVDIGDPVHPVVVDSIAMPYGVRRFRCDSAHVYAMCYYAGVCILDTFEAGVTEPEHAAVGRYPQGLVGTIARDKAAIVYWADEADNAQVMVFDAVGRMVLGPWERRCAVTGRQGTVVDMARLPAGAYVIGVAVGRRTEWLRIIKLSGR
jgi:hypothetical protein